MAQHGSEIAETADGRPAGPVDLAPVMPGLEVGQGTAVEIGRAVAEVQAAVIVAQRIPRNLARAEQNMIRSCQRPEMARQAFYSYRRAGNQITGPTVQLMREIMRCFGNCQSGIGELRRERGRSEMIAWAWDLENNVRMSTTFFTSHARDRSEERGGRVELDSDRDIYENNANLGARREREMIRRILPAWYVEVALETSRQALVGKPEEFGGRVANAVAAFAKLGVTEAMLVNKLGAARQVWTAIDLGVMITLYQTIQRAETNLAAEFPELHREQAGSAAEALAAAGAAADQAAQRQAGESSQDTAPAGGQKPPAPQRQARPGPARPPKGHGRQ